MDSHLAGDLSTVGWRMDVGGTRRAGRILDEGEEFDGEHSLTALAGGRLAKREPRSTLAPSWDFRLGFLPQTIFLPRMPLPTQIKRSVQNTATIVKDLNQIVKK